MECLEMTNYHLLTEQLAGQLEVEEAFRTMLDQFMAEALKFGQQLMKVVVRPDQLT
jgi:hypothetical protein